MTEHSEHHGRPTSRQDSFEGDDRAPELGIEDPADRESTRTEAKGDVGGCRLCHHVGVFTAVAGEPLDRELSDRNIVAGSKIVLWMVALYILAVIILLILLPKGATWHHLVDAIRLDRVYSCLAIHLLTIISLSYCLMKPNLPMYLVTIIIWIAFFAILHLFPQFVSNLDSLFEFKSAIGVPAEQIGFLAIHGIMYILLLLPLLVPEQRFMPSFLWGWMAVFVIICCVCIGVDDLCDQKAAEIRYLYNFDFIVSVLVLSVVCLVVSQKRKAKEDAELAQFRADLRRRQASERKLQILGCMLPPFAVMPLFKDPARMEPFAYHVDCASILFIMFVDFDQIVRSISSPNGLMDFLNRYFTQIDKICIKYGVTKIETVGGEYVCAVGVGPDASEQQESVGQLVHVACEVLHLRQQLPDDQPVAFQMGIHTGPVVAGVVGKRLPRFRLFGDTVNTAARMMQKGLPGQVQFGEATRQKLPPWALVEERGRVEMKGKGWVTTYVLCSDLPTIPAADSFTTCSSDAVCLRPSVVRIVTDQFDRPAVLQSSTTPKSISFETAFFESVLQIQASSIQDDAAHSCLAPLSRLIWSERMQQVSDKDFREWFHTTCFCKNLFQRIGKQAKMFIALTGVEMLYMVCNMDFNMRKLEDLLTFFACRLTCIVIMLTWLVLTGSPQWVRRSYRWSQRWILVSWCTILALTYISYNSLPVIFPLIPKTVAKLPYFPLIGVSTNPVFLLCFPVCISLMSDTFPFTFLQSCALTIILFLVLVLEDTIAELHPTTVMDNFLIRSNFVTGSVMCCVLAYQREARCRDQYVAQLATERTLHTIEDILATLMPPMVVQGLRKGPVGARLQHQYLHSTVVQSDLVGFTQLASTRTPEDVVQIISELFGVFDKLADKYGIYKVETVGDAYIAGSASEPLTTVNSPLSVVLFGLAIVKNCRWWSQKEGEDVTCRVGVGTGECVGGIVGSEMQRYHLFGPLMTEVEVLESTGPSGRVHVSGACKRAVEWELEGRSALSRHFSNRCTFEPRTETELATSKGETHDFAEVGGLTFLVNVEC